MFRAPLLIVSKLWKQSTHPPKWGPLSEFWCYTHLLEYYKCIAGIYVDCEIGLYCKYVSVLHEKFRLDSEFMMYVHAGVWCVCMCVNWSWNPGLLTHIGFTDKKSLGTNSLETLNVLSEASQQTHSFAWKTSAGFWKGDILSSWTANQGKSVG